MRKRTNIVVSVQHTGARLLTRELGGVAGEYVTPRNMNRVHRMLLKHTDGCVPLRHPARVYESWSRRGRDLSKLTTQYANLLLVDEMYGLQYYNVEATPGSPITREMSERVPAWVLEWYYKVLPE